MEDLKGIYERFVLRRCMVMISKCIPLIRVVESSSKSMSCNTALMGPRERQGSISDQSLTVILDLIVDLLTIIFGVEEQFIAHELSQVLEP